MNCLPELELSDVHFSIGRISILNGLSFKINPGETVGIIGPNGSGKTTLFNCLSGFNFVSQGRISLNGSDITTMKPHRRAISGIGRVFQNCGIFKEMTLEENLLTALESKSMPQGKNRSGLRKKDEVLRYLSMVGLQSKIKDKAGSLSGGQMRLLEIVRTLAFGARVFLLDEPTAGVSPKMKGDIVELIKKLKSSNCTTLIIEHDINFIQQFCDRIIVLDLGKIVLNDTPEKVRSNPLLHEIYFGKVVESNQLDSPS